MRSHHDLRLVTRTCRLLGLLTIACGPDNASKQWQPLRSCQPSVQGFGNVGAWAAEIFEEHGGKVLAVSDANSAIFNENGLDIVALRRHVASKQPLSIFPEGDIIPQHCASQFRPLHRPMICTSWTSHPHEQRHFRQHPAPFRHPPAGTPISKDEILETPCDVLVPAAIGGIITGKFMHQCSQHCSVLHSQWLSSVL